MNKTINVFLKQGKITQNEYDILFCSKDNFSTDSTKQEIFKQVLQKVIDLQKNSPIVDLSWITFYHFYFIHFKWGKWQKISFRNAIFIDEANFQNIKFSGHTNFEKVVFFGKSNFKNATFNGHTYFKDTEFHGQVNFIAVLFNKKAYFTNVIFHNRTYFKNSEFIYNAYFHNVTFMQKTEFVDAIFRAKTYFTKTIFINKVYFKNAVFKQLVNFDNVDFKEITIFKNTIFKDNATFKGASFDEWVSFKNINSYKKLDFTYSRTKDIIDFSDSKIYCIDLEYARFNTTGFLWVKGLNENKQITILTKSNFANRESARLIKALFEKENNISEANKYFQIEQDLYLDELKNKTSLEANKEITKFVLRLNKYVSDYGTNWIKPLLVMLIFGFVAGLGYSLLETGNKEINFSDKKEWLSIGIIYSIIIYYFYHKKIWVALTVSIIVFLSVLIYDLNLREIGNDISTLINPLNIFKPKANYFESIALYGMLVKFSMSVLIYQFIMAFRQNTRRK